MLLAVLQLMVCFDLWYWSNNRFPSTGSSRLPSLPARLREQGFPETLTVPWTPTPIIELGAHPRLIALIISSGSVHANSLIHEMCFINIFGGLEFLLGCFFYCTLGFITLGLLPCLLRESSHPAPSSPQRHGMHQDASPRCSSDSQYLHISSSI